MHSLLLFARSPEREAAAKRMPGAAPLFSAVIAAWLDAARRHGAAALIACEAEDRAALAKIAPHVERRWIEQRGRTFGERVVAAAGEAFAGSDAVIIAAIDAPPPRDLGAAFAAVASGRVVVGPARDGGVNFIGLARLDAALLANLTLRRCRERCARLLVLRAVTDLDSPASVSAARNERAWRAIFESRAQHHVAFAKPRVVAVRSLPPRAPPG
jgi:glycosyltransferase A (GT-A) superfamily protein (DUF2064 family)